MLYSFMQVLVFFWEKFEGKFLENYSLDINKEDFLYMKVVLVMCENIDWNVGCLMEKFDVLDFMEEIIVIYFFDNGLNGWWWNGGMKG